jgi:hypothetical protein
MIRRIWKSHRRLWLIGIASVVAEPVIMKLRGYPIGGKLVVRCRKGHRFTTFWIPGVSLKACGSAGGATSSAPSAATGR